MRLTEEEKRIIADWPEQDQQVAKNRRRYLTESRCLVCESSLVSAKPLPLPVRVQCPFCDTTYTLHYDEPDNVESLYLLSQFVGDPNMAKKAHDLFAQSSTKRDYLKALKDL